jgi:hypothetical protein
VWRVILAVAVTGCGPPERPATIANRAPEPTAVEVHPVNVGTCPEVLHAYYLCPPTRARAMGSCQVGQFHAAPLPASGMACEYGDGACTCTVSVPLPGAARGDGGGTWKCVDWQPSTWPDGCPGDEPRGGEWPCKPRTRCSYRDDHGVITRYACELGHFQPVR